MGATTPAKSVLIAPQASLDKTPPIVDIPSFLRIPVYTEREYLQSEVITEAGTYAIQADVDAATDTNGDGVPNNDLVSSGTGFSQTPTLLRF